jgi:hypothetical protein
MCRPVETPRMVRVSTRLLTEPRAGARRSGTSARLSANSWKLEQGRPAPNKNTNARPALGEGHVVPVIRRR